MGDAPREPGWYWVRVRYTEFGASTTTIADWAIGQLRDMRGDPDDGGRYVYLCGDDVEWETSAVAEWGPRLAPPSQSQTDTTTIAEDAL